MASVRPPLPEPDPNGGDERDRPARHGVELGGSASMHDLAIARREAPGALTLSLDPNTLPTVFPARIANLVTALATTTRLSLRVTAFFMEAILETSQYSTRMGLGYTRRILISAISSARRVYLASNAALEGDLLGAMGFTDKQAGSSDAFLNVLDRWTNVGIYVIHHTFTMAELFAMSGFYLTANTVSSASFAANESVTLFDSLFGSNESSRALSSIITLVRKELLEDERFQAADRGKVASLTALTKALTAFACLQSATWHRSSKRIRMRVLHDCTVMISSNELMTAKRETIIDSELPAIEAGPSQNTIMGRLPTTHEIPSIAMSVDSDDNSDGDVVIATSSAIASPSSDRTSRTSRRRGLGANDGASSADLELLRQLEDLVGETDDFSDPSDAEPRRRSRTLKRVREDMFEITDEVSESTVVTQTFERMSSPRERPRTLKSLTSISSPDVLIETLEPADDVSMTTTPAPTPRPTAPTSVCEVEADETDWIEVDHLLDDAEEGDEDIIPSAPNGRVADVANNASTDGIQLVLRTMTNKLLQRKRTVRVRMDASSSPSPPPTDRSKRGGSSRSKTPVFSGGMSRRDDARPDVRSIQWGSGDRSSPQRTAPRIFLPTMSGRSSPSKGKGKATMSRGSAPKEEPRRQSSASSLVGNAFRSALRTGSGKAQPTTSTSRVGSIREIPSPEKSSVKHPREPFPNTSPTRANTIDESTSTLSRSRAMPQLAPSSKPQAPPSPPATLRPPRPPPPSPYHGRKTRTTHESVRSNRMHTSSSQIFNSKRDVDTPASLFPHEGLIRNIHRFMRYSSAAYGQNFLRIFGLGNADFNFPTTGRHHANSWAFAQHTNIPIDALLLSSYTESSPTFASDKVPPLVHYIAVEHNLKAIVLTCRGTLGLSDVLVDLTCDYRDIKLEHAPAGGEYYVHAGMYESALQLTAKESTVHQTLVDALVKYPNYGLVLCGHSLGGGVAALLSMTASVRAEDFAKLNAARACPVSHPPISTPFVTSFNSGLPPGRPIHCYAYGVPAVASPDLAKYARGLITSVVQNADVVPTLSLGVLRDLKNIAVTLFEESGVAEEIVGRVIGLNRSKFAFQRDGAGPAPPTSSEDQVLSDWMMSLIKTMRADMDNDKLFPPGTVYIMEYFDVFVTSDMMNAAGDNALSSQQAQRVILRQCESVEERFREPLFSKSMLNDHLPSHYERSTQLLYDGLGQGLL